MPTLTTILTRTSYRGKYTPTPVPREHLRQLLEAGLAAPSGCNKQTTSLIAFAGDKYYKSAMYGGPSSTGLSLSISNGKLSGLPSGLTAISAIVTRGI